MIIKDAVFAGSSVTLTDRPKVRYPEFAFIGRSNVGKSSLINTLTSRNGLAKTSSTPGKTQLINHFLINGSWYLVDLPGYGYAKLGQQGRDKIRAIIDGYVNGSEEMALLFVLLDSRHDLQKIDLEFMTMLGENGVPFAIIFTKCDKSGSSTLASQIKQTEQSILEYWEELPPVFLTSSKDGRGREEVLAFIEKTLTSL